MNCLGDETVFRFLRGDLPAEARSGVEAHIVECADCRGLVADAAHSVHDPNPGSDHGPEGTAREPETIPDLAAGDLVGRYVVAERIAVGGMGVVYAAHDPRLNRKIALKLLREDPGEASGRRQAYLLREAQAMAQLSHPNVVSIYDAGTFRGQIFLAMELVDGRTLKQWLGEAARSWRDVVNVFLEAGRGLVAAHAAGIVHRDFKPTNVLVGTDGRVRVTDFGLARPVDAVPEIGGEPGALSSPTSFGAWDHAVTLTRTGALVGTPAYMAPEQLRCEKTDARTDQFSFCVTLYEALYGARPVSHRAVPDDAAQQKKPARGLEVPPKVHAAVLRGLSVPRDERFPTMDDLLRALAEESARVEPSKERRWGRLRRATVLAAATASILVVAALARSHRGAAGADALTPPGPAAMPETALPDAPAPPGSVSAQSSPAAASPADPQPPKLTIGRPVDRGVKHRGRSVAKPRAVPGASAATVRSTPSARPYDDQPMAPSFGQSAP